MHTCVHKRSPGVTILDRAAVIGGGGGDRGHCPLPKFLEINEKVGTGPPKIFSFRRPC